MAALSRLPGEEDVLQGVPIDKPETLPAPDERLVQGNLDKKFLTSKGIKWITRYSVLSKDYLCFAKMHLRKTSVESPTQASLNLAK